MFKDGAAVNRSMNLLRIYFLFNTTAIFYRTHMSGTEYKTLVIMKNSSNFVLDQ